SGAEVSRYLDFKFSRVYDGTKIDRIMGSVTDVSHAVKLEELLQQEREQNESQANLLNLVLQADRSIMQDFVRKSDHRLDSINSILREPGKSSHDMQDKAQRIAREIHSLKGEASALKLRNYVTACEQFEDIVKPLRDREDLTYENFLPLTIKLDEIVSTNRMLAGIMEKLSQYANAGASLATPSATAVASNGETLTGDDAMRKYYTSFAHDIAERNGKKVSLNVKGLGTVPLSTEQRDLVQEIAVQLLRNSIVHGIEESKLREAIGKNKIGQIQLLLQRNKDGTATLTVEDDGSGIKYEKIREKALKSGKYSAAEVAAWDNQKLLKLMFSSGFSTADKQSEDAGRGVGMDIIKDRINQLKGKMQIGSKRNVFTRFSINFPLKK
ncbi:MAG: Hpt domain-containing protein, partial [Neisseriaceae bacterium]|nr:Hpt domain-containing protein [Neisseriaceae bacterium]